MQAGWVRRLGAFIRLGRPVFLVGGLAPYALGAAIANYRGHSIDWTRFSVGQVAITATQLMTHYSNDYFDVQADRANPTPTRWSGGSRVLPNGELPAWIALAAAIGLATIAVVATIVLQTSLSAGPISTGLLALALLLSWEYSAPPLHLHSRGAGEFVATVIVAFLVPLIGFSIQTGRVEALVFVSAAPLGCLQFAMLLAVEFPDAVGDAAVGKRTLVVRYGSRATAFYLVALALAYLLLPVLTRLGLPTPVALAAGVLAPLAAWLGACVLKADDRQPGYWNRLAFGSVALVTLSTLLELGSYVAISSWDRGPWG